MFPGSDIVGLSEGDIELAVGPHITDPGGVIEADKFRGNQFAFRDHFRGHHITAFIEEFCRRVGQNPVLLGDIEHSSRGEAGAIGNGFSDGRGEILHFVRDPVLVPVGDCPDFALAGTDKGHHPLGANSHMPGIGDQGIEMDLETFRQAYFLQGLADDIRAVGVLGNHGELGFTGGLEASQLIQRSVGLSEG